jgi:hypothetical protein
VNAAAHLPLAAARQAVTRPLCWACNLCRHMREEGIERLCTHPSAQEPFTGSQPVAIVRAPGAACGPRGQLMQSVDTVDTTRGDL